MLYCSDSLLREETDEMVARALSSLGPYAKLVRPAELEHVPEMQELLVASKKLGVEVTEMGWRMLPDLSFQKAQFFSIIERTVQHT